MRHQNRLPHLAKRHTGHEEPQQQQQYQEQQPVREQPEAPQVPRPVFPSINAVPFHDKFRLRSDTWSFPPADSLFTTQNTFDAGPNFLRPTSGILPASSGKFNFPLAAWIMPLGPDSSIVPSVTVKAPLRCVRCKAYANPYFKFDVSNNITCNICGHRYVCQEKIDPNILNSTELYTSGVFDFKVSDPMYFKKDFSKVKVFLLLEMTKNTIETGVFVNVIDSVKSCIGSFQFDAGVRIGIATYNMATTFYRVRNLEEEPIQYVVADTTDAMCPLSEKDLFYDPNDEDSKNKLLFLLDKLVESSQNFKNINSSCNYHSSISCVSTGFGNNAGRIVLFSINEPSAAPGRIHQRQKQQIKTPLKPLHQQYRLLAKDLVTKRIGLDHFVFGKQGHTQHQLATTHFLASSTGGNLYHYLIFSPQFNGEHLYFSIYSNLTRECAYDVNFTCRMSNGLSTSKFLVGDGFHPDRDVSLGILDSSQSVTVYFQQEEKLSDASYLQFAMMYTNSRSERIIRIINFKFLISDKLEQIHMGCDYLAVASAVCKEHANQMTKAQGQKVIESLMTHVTGILHQYKAEKGQTKYSQLQVQQNMKNMLSYVHGVLTSNIFTNLNRNIPDARIVQLTKLNSFSFMNFANRYYPKLYSIDLSIYDKEPLPGDFIESTDIAVLPPNLPLTVTSINQQSAYLCNDSQYLYLIVMPQSQPDLLTELFGVEQLGEIPSTLPQLQSGHNVRVTNIIGEIRRRNSSLYLPLLVITPGMKAIFDDRLMNILKEDNRERPYMQFLKQLHARIQGK